MLDKKQLFNNLQAIKNQSPIVHNITNQVVMNFTANVLLALRASPIMAHAKEEIAEIINLSKALLLNIGTLDHTLIDCMHLAQKHANDKKIPIVLDPVGAGASLLRTQSAKDLLKKGITVLKGNANEILALADFPSNSQGINSNINNIEALQAAKKISNKYQCIVVISGKNDYIVGKNKLLTLKNGNPIMQSVTGTGCIGGSVIAAFLAINNNSFDATAYAMATVSLAGEIAAKKASGPGSFINHFLDELYHLNENDLSGICYE
ncbi:hydroxyethylthiazole kinase [Thiotrichales bacterium 19S11-10]|nr:hydroxyethylthiazole kinase [Thiotrichales bacterium 19S11-10]